MTGIPSDHPSIATVEARLDADATGRMRVALATDAGLPTDADATGVGGDVVRVVVDGANRYARPRPERTGDRVLLPAAYDAPETARDPGPGATDRLAEWVRARGLSAGDAVLVDCLDRGVRYGLRAPGERTVYDERRSVEDSLSSIARDLDGE